MPDPVVKTMLTSAFEAPAILRASSNACSADLVGSKPEKALARATTTPSLRTTVFTVCIPFHADSYHIYTFLL